MAQASRHKDRSSETGKDNKLNAAAPEFVPRQRIQAHMPQMQGNFYPYFQYPHDGATGNWIYLAPDDERMFPHRASTPHHNHYAKEAVTLTDELKSSIIKQAEYLFSDLSLLANESFSKHVTKDPEGFVPINFVTTTKKLKSLNVTNHMVVKALMSSPNLVVSSDGKRVRRRQPFTDKDKEELQMKTVIGENLPDDHSHENIEKLFSVVGNVKSICICQPQDTNTSRSTRSDIVISNKLHALVEYEKAESAEKAAEQLNDEQNWRKGMRVRLMLKRSSSKNLMKNRRSLDGHIDDDEGPGHQPLQECPSLRSSMDQLEPDESSRALKKGGWLPTRGKPTRTSSLPVGSSENNTETPTKQITKGPRMPDGTRGFTMGRGKPLFLQVQSG